MYKYKTAYSYQKVVFVSKTNDETAKNIRIDKADFFSDTNSIICIKKYFVSINYFCIKNVFGIKNAQRRFVS